MKTQDEPCYYILNARGLPDNAALWWGPKSNGYTRDFDEAGLYSHEQAQRICGNGRITDIAVHRDVARASVVSTVRIDRLANDPKVRAALDVVSRANYEDELARDDLDASTLREFLDVEPFEYDTYDAGVTVLRDTIVTAAKAHECNKCRNKDIRKGQPHRCRVETSESKAITYRWCHRCSGLIMGYPYAGAPEPDNR